MSFVNDLGKKTTVEGVVSNASDNKAIVDWGFVTKDNILPSDVCTALDILLGRTTVSGEKFKITIEQG